MKKSCKYCGRVHPMGCECPARPMRKKRGARKPERIRSTYAWQKKRAEIKERDHHLCVYNLAHGRIVYGDLEVHHIIPLEERPDLALTDWNLITLSGAVHERAERGEIGREELLALVRHPPPGVPTGKNREGAYTTCPLTNTQDARNEVGAWAGGPRRRLS